MTPNPAAVAALVEHLRARHAELQSWRKVANEYNNPIIKFGTLQRIAKGKYMPLEKKILRVLIPPERRKRTEIEKRISQMVKETRKAVMVTK